MFTFIYFYNIRELPVSLSIHRKPDCAFYLGSLLLLLPLLFLSLHQPLLGQEELLVQHVSLVLCLQVEKKKKKASHKERDGIMCMLLITSGYSPLFQLTLRVDFFFSNQFYVATWLTSF